PRVHRARPPVRAGRSGRNGRRVRPRDPSPVRLVRRRTADPTVAARDRIRAAAVSGPLMATTSRRALRAAAMAAICRATVSDRAFAQTPADLAGQIAALRAEVDHLRAELEALKGAGAAGTEPTPATIEVLQSQVAELAQLKVESASRLPVRLFGTVHAGVFANSGSANWLDNPNLVSAAPAADTGTMSASLRQTRIGFAADGPTVGAMRTNAVVAMD